MGQSKSGAIALVLCMAASAWAAGAERATAKEAETMVKKAVVQIKEDRDRAFADISNPKGPYVDRDLYLVVYRTDGTNMAHGFNQKMVGKSFMEIRDIDGKEYMRERMDLAKTKSSFWQDLKFIDPLTKKIEPKQIYCEKAGGELLVCGGIYKM
jgi:cytochrome c